MKQKMKTIKGSAAAADDCGLLLVFPDDELPECPHCGHLILGFAITPIDGDYFVHRACSCDCSVTEQRFAASASLSSVYSWFAAEVGPHRVLDGFLRRRFETISSYFREQLALQVGRPGHPYLQ